MWRYGIWIHSPLTSVGVVHSIWPSLVMWHMHTLTFNKWHKKKKKKVTLHILTHGTVRGCGLIALMDCINDVLRDIRERNVTIRSKIWTMYIHSLGFRDIREWVILWMLILWSLGCIGYTNLAPLFNYVCLKPSWFLTCIFLVFLWWLRGYQNFTIHRVVIHMLKSFAK